MYCKEGHKGPLCEVCTDDNFYYSDVDGNCVKCPSPTTVALVLVAIVLGVIIVAAVIVFLGSKRGTFLASCMNLIPSLSLQAKSKLLVSFYQILSSFEDVYGVRLHDSFTAWLEVLSFLSFNIFQIFGIDKSCITSDTLRQIAIGALWPYILVVIVSIAAALYKIYVLVRRSFHEKEYLISNRKYIKVDLKSWIIRGTVILLYFVIPTVTNSIFDAIKCRAFDDDDLLGSSVSYLLIDMEIKCDTNEDTNYCKISAVFWVFFVVWVILTPLGFVFKDPIEGIVKDTIPFVQDWFQAKSTIGPQELNSYKRRQQEQLRAKKNVFRLLENENALVSKEYKSSSTGRMDGTRNKKGETSTRKHQFIVS